MFLFLLGGNDLEFFQEGGYARQPYTGRRCVRIHKHMHTARSRRHGTGFRKNDSGEMCSCIHRSIATGTYKTQRYLLDLETMQRLRAERAKFEAPACGADEAAARRLGDAEAALKALLPAEPNERMVYKCNVQGGG